VTEIPAPDDRQPASDFDLEQLVQGSQKAVRWLRERCERRAAPRFSTWAWEWLREDFVGDLLLQLTVTASKPEFELRGSVDGYIDICIFNLCRRYYSRLAVMRRQDTLDVVAESLAAPQPDALERVAVALDMRRALGRMRPDCRRILLRKYVDELSLEEIGARLDITAKTARSRLHSCRERLRSIWAQLSSDASKVDPAINVGASRRSPILDREGEQ